MRFRALILCLVLGACEAPAPPPPTPTPGAAVCPQSMGYLDEVGPGLEVVLDAVALPTATVLQPHPASEPGWMVANVALLVRAGREVRLRLNPVEAQHARLDFPEHYPASCSTLPGWIVYGGGYLVDRPRCVHVLVITPEQQVERRIGVGVSC